jgi:hypothetical protein
MILVIRKEESTVYLKAPSLHSSGGSGENHAKSKKGNKPVGKY